MQAHGIGTATIDEQSGDVLDVLYSSYGVDDDSAGDPGADPGGDGVRDELRGVRLERVETKADLDTPPGDAADAYLRLHLLSARLVEPNGQNLDGLFGVLTLVAWTDLGPIHPDQVDRVRLAVRARGGHLVVNGLDKFPRMTDYVTPSGVRIADASRVRLGAHLAAGTVVMHHGLVNFNAGTLGPVMVEGRITAGTVVDADSDVGGGASIQGTLSGGGTHRARIGKRCLLGANSGVSISLGDDSAVEAGLYVTSGTLVTLPDGSVVKARELSGHEGMLLRRNSVTGTVEAVPWKQSSFAGLNPDLHT